MTFRAANDNPLGPCVAKEPKNIKVAEIRQNVRMQRVTRRTVGLGHARLSISLTSSLQSSRGEFFGKRKTGRGKKKKTSRDSFKAIMSGAEGRISATKALFAFFGLCLQIPPPSVKSNRFSVCLPAVLPITMRLFSRIHKATFVNQKANVPS